MKKAALRIACLVLCLVLCGCVAKKEFDGQTGSSASGQSAADDTAKDASSAVQECKNLFPWRGYTMNASSIVDDGSITSGSYTPTGRLIQIHLDCVDGVMSWDSISNGYMDYSLQDASGTEYTAVSTGFSVTEGASLNIRDLESNDYVGMAPTFDIPLDADTADFTLYVKTDKADERITIALKDIEIQQ